MTLLGLWLRLPTAESIEPKVFKYHLPHRDTKKVLSHGEIDTSSHGVIHTEYDSSCYTCAYYFSFLIYEVAQEAVDFPLAFPHSGSIWWEAEKQLEKNVTTDP